MPKVTLLADDWQNYLLGYGKGMYEFKGGRALDVPVAVALEAKKRTKNGVPLFHIEDMPEIVEPDSDIPINTVEQNVKGKEKRQKAQGSLF